MQATEPLDLTPRGGVFASRSFACAAWQPGGGGKAAVAAGTMWCQSISPSQTLTVSFWSTVGKVLLASAVAKFKSLRSEMG